MRLSYLSATLSLLILTGGCASNPNHHKLPVLTKAWHSSRAVLGKVTNRCQLCNRKSQLGVLTTDQQPCGCGCDHVAQEPITQGCDCGAEVPLAQECGCNQLQDINTQQTSILESYDNPALFVEENQGNSQGISQGISLTEPPPVIQDQPSLETSPETDWAPVETPEPRVNVEQGQFDEVTPELLEAPSIEEVPYVEPALDPTPVQSDGVGVLELDDDAGFLSPQSLTDSEDELAEETTEEDTDENAQDPNELESALGPTEAELAQKNILEPAKDTGPVVLRARPVANHTVNDQRVLQYNEAIATSGTDAYGLPLNSNVQFSELPPLDVGTSPRPVSFQREEMEAPPEMAPPAKHIEEAEFKDKTTRVETQELQVVESTTNVPTDAKPMLRMTAIPYAGSSSLGAAIARIKVGKTPLVVRGAYPREVEYERLARERNEQSTRSVIIPNTSLKTIDR